jgi:hypothetical protein
MAFAMPSNINDSAKQRFDPSKPFFNFPGAGKPLSENPVNDSSPAGYTGEPVFIGGLNSPFNPNGRT